MCISIAYSAGKGAGNKDQSNSIFIHNINHKESVCFCYLDEPFISTKGASYVPGCVVGGTTPN